MPSPFHDHAVDLLESMLMCILARTARRLRSSNGGVKIATELERVYKGRSASVELSSIGGIGRVRKTSKAEKRSDTVAKKRRKDALTRHPDSSFYHPAQPHLPTTVVEVAFSQGRRKLWRLAESYIHHAQVQCVIALELPYRRRSDKSIGSGAAISVWRPRSVECHPIDLRAGGSNVLKADSLDLYPTDFLPKNVLSAGSYSPAAVIPMELPLAPLASVLSIAKSRMNTLELLHQPCWATSTIDFAMLDRTPVSQRIRAQTNQADQERAWLSWWKS